MICVIVLFEASFSPKRARKKSQYTVGSYAGVYLTLDNYESADLAVAYGVVIMVCVVIETARIVEITHIVQLEDIQCTRGGSRV